MVQFVICLLQGSNFPMEVSLTFLPVHFYYDSNVNGEVGL